MGDKALPRICGRAPTIRGDTGVIPQDKMYESEADARRKIEKLTTYTQNLIKAIEKKELERDQVLCGQAAFLAHALLCNLARSGVAGRCFVCLSPSCSRSTGEARQLRRVGPARALCVQIPSSHQSCAHHITRVRSSSHANSTLTALRPPEKSRYRAAAPTARRKGERPREGQGRD